MTARFGEILRKRRQELHYDIRTVSNVIKIRPQILEMFENGDLENIPPRGYARGMIATYARYLNLNPSMVIDVYMDDLVEYEQNKGHAGNYAGAVLDISSRPGTPGGYDTATRPVQLSNARAPRPMQQAGYVTDSTSHHMGMSAEEMRSSSGPSRSYEPTPGPYTQRFGAPSQQRNYNQSRYEQPYNAQRPYPADERTRQMPSSARMNQQAGRRPDMRTRQMPPYGQEPRPDMYDRRAPQYSGGAAGGRPNRASRPASNQSRPSSGLANLLNDPKSAFTMLGIVLLIVILIGAFVWMSFRSKDSEPETPVTQEQTDKPSTDTPADSSDDSKPAASTDDKDEDADKDKDVPTEARIKIIIKDGMSTWLEVKNGGKTIHANTVTGPLEFEWVVTDTMEITVGDADAVTITNNGESVAFDTKTSGVNRVTIKEPEPPEPEENKDQDPALASDIAGEDTTSDTTTSTR